MLTLFNVECIGQTITNVRAFEESGTVMVLYDLFTTKPTKEFYISLFASTDDGKTFNEIGDAKGDVDKIVKTGSDKTINWAGKRLGSDSKIFKVVALSAISTGDNLALINLTRRTNDAVLYFKIVGHESNENNRQKPIETYILANFKLVNQSNESFKPVTGTNVVSLKQGERKQYQLTLKDVPTSFNELKSIEFDFSENHLKFYDITIMPQDPQDQ